MSQAKTAFNQTMALTCGGRLKLKDTGAVKALVSYLHLQLRAPVTPHTRPRASGLA